MPKQKRRHWNSVESRLHFAKPYADGFENWLQDHGYTPSTIEERVRLLAGWADWMHAAGFSLDNILEGLAASAAVFKGKKSIRAYAGAGRLFVRFLQDQGILPRSAPPPSLAEQWPIFGTFRAWARQHRGIAHSTLDLWQRSIIDMLKALGDDPKAPISTGETADLPSAENRGAPNGFRLPRRSATRSWPISNAPDLAFAPRGYLLASLHRFVR